jgi:hypothetical protein
MGWNTGFRIFEKQVIDTYDLGKLDKELLSVLMRPFAYSDIDSGGEEGLITQDGKDIYQVVIGILGTELPEKPIETDDEELWEKYNDQIYEMFAKITDQFHW